MKQITDSRPRHNGNRTSDPSGAQYGWDFENRLTQVILPGTGGTVNFKYDPFGRRLQKAFTQNGTTTTTNYLYDGANILETTDQSANVLARYTDSLGVAHTKLNGPVDILAEKRPAPEGRWLSTRAKTSILPNPAFNVVFAHLPDAEAERFAPVLGSWG